MPAPDRRSNYQFHVSEEAFQTIVQAIAARSLDSQKLETLSSVMEYMITNQTHPAPLETLAICENKQAGDIRVSMSLKGALLKPFELFVVEQFEPLDGRKSSMMLK